MNKLVNQQKMKCYLSDSLLSNAIYLMSTTFLTTFLGFLFWLITARIYTPQDIGFASNIISSMNLITLLSLFGFNIAFIRFLPISSEKDSLINTGFSLSIIASLILSILFLYKIELWSPKLIFLKENPVFSLLFILMSCLWLITTLLNNIFISNRSSIYVLEKELLFGFVRIIFPIFLVSFGSIGIFLSWGIGSIIALIFGIVLLFRIHPSYCPQIQFKKEIIYSMFNFSFGNYIANLMTSTPALILPIIITTIASPEAGAYFYITWMMANLLFAIPSQVSQSLLAEGSSNSSTENHNTIKSIKFIVVLLVPSIVFIILFGNKLLNLFGPQYSIEGTELLKILSASALPFAINSVYISEMRIKQKTSRIILVTSMISITTILISFLVVGSMGIIGVGYVWILANSICAGAISISLIKNRWFGNVK